MVLFIVLRCAGVCIILSIPFISMTYMPNKLATECKITEVDSQHLAVRCM